MGLILIGGILFMALYRDEAGNLRDDQELISGIFGQAGYASNPASPAVGTGYPAMRGAPAYPPASPTVGGGNYLGSRPPMPAQTANPASPSVGNDYPATRGPRPNPASPTVGNGQSVGSRQSSWIRASPTVGNGQSTGSRQPSPYDNPASPTVGNGNSTGTRPRKGFGEF